MLSMNGVAQFNAAEHVQPWFAISVRTKFETRVAQCLSLKGFECFVPTDRLREWPETARDRSVRALFPGYLFCRLDITKRLPILTTPGVAKILGVGPNPICVEESEIYSIREAIRRRYKLTLLPNLVPGTAVQIVDGPMRGLSGFLCDVRRRNRLVVTVQILQRSVMIEIDPTNLRAPEPWIEQSSAPA